MITVIRGELMDSKAAIENLGKVYIPADKAKYWFIKTLSKVQKVLRQNGVLSQKESNRLVEELGTEQPNKTKGIAPTDSATMKQYTEAMEAFMEQPVEIDVRKISLADLAANQVSLTANDQIALMWLIDEDGPELTVVK
jgi:hypothetical protein